MMLRRTKSIYERSSSRFNKTTFHNPQQVKEMHLVVCVAVTHLSNVSTAACIAAVRYKVT